MRVAHRAGSLDVLQLWLTRTFAGWFGGGPDVAWLRAVQLRAAAGLDERAIVRALPAGDAGGGDDCSADCSADRAAAVFAAFAVVSFALEGALALVGASRPCR